MPQPTFRVCVRCIMDTTDPFIAFDAAGVCNHCREFDENARLQWFPNAEGQSLLEASVARIKEAGRGKEYDSVLGLSGGVDSTYLAYKCKEWGLRPLAVHVDAGWNSELAVKNIENIVKKLDFDLYTVVIDWDEIRDLQIAFLRSGVANQDVPQDHCFQAAVYRYAAKHGIRHILSGGNFATESILPKEWAYNAMDLRHLKGIHKRFGSRKLRTFPTINFFQYYFYYPYVKKIRSVRLLNYVPYDKRQAMDVLKKELDWRDYGAKHCESRFTKFQQAYYRPVRFGYEERKAYLSSLILSGQITREYAVNEMKNELYTPEALRDDKTLVMKKLGLTEAEFEAIMAVPVRTYRDYPSNQWLFTFKDRVKGAIHKLRLGRQRAEPSVKGVIPALRMETGSAPCSSTETLTEAVSGNVRNRR